MGHEGRRVDDVRNTVRCIDHVGLHCLADTNRFMTEEKGDILVKGKKKLSRTEEKSTAHFTLLTLRTEM